MAVKLFIVLAAIYLEQVSGHGMMLEPLNRGSLWRTYSSIATNYEDNQFFCGGVEAQYGENGGKCGPCGDNYADPQPRSNENTGTFGIGIVTAEYKSGGIITATSWLTANHLGSISYSLCVLKDVNQPESDTCFEDLKLVDGSDKYSVRSNDYTVVNQVQLPAGLTCDRCVLRWHYRTGNSWGVCEDGTGAVGCGDQEIFRSCADIRIL